MERLQKVLAQAGLASRRAAEQIILAGRVRVDGKVVTELGTQVDPRKSRVEVDGKKIVAENLVYIVLHKPRGVVCTLSDPEGRPTIRELLKEAGGRVVPVGRLDFHTSGALLCTNDGEFSQALAHPKRSVPKVYVAKVKGTVDDDALPKFSESIEIDGRATQPAQVRRLRYEGDKTWLEITLREGRNRQVRRLGEATGFPVMRLARISHAGVTSEDLRPGQWRPLTVDELVDLKKTYGVPKKVRSAQLEPLKGKEAKNRMRARPDVRGEVHSRTTSAEREAAKRGTPARGEERFSSVERSEAKPSRFDRSAKPSRFGRTDAKPSRFERAEKPQRFAGTEAKPSRFERSEGKPSRFDRSAKPARFERADAKPPRFARAEKPSRFAGADAKPSRFERAEKPSRFGRSDAKPSRFERADARPERASRADKKPARPERTAPPRGATTKKAPRDGRASSPRRGTSR